MSMSYDDVREEARILEEIEGPDEDEFVSDVDGVVEELGININSVGKNFFYDDDEGIEKFADFDIHFTVLDYDKMELSAFGYDLDDTVDSIQGSLEDVKKEIEHMSDSINLYLKENMLQTEMRDFPLGKLRKWLSPCFAPLNIRLRTDNENNTMVYYLPYRTKEYVTQDLTDKTFNDCLNLIVCDVCSSLYKIEDDIEKIIDEI